MVVQSVHCKKNRTWLEIGGLKIVSSIPAAALAFAAAAAATAGKGREGFWLSSAILQ